MINVNELYFGKLYVLVKEEYKDSKFEKLYAPVTEVELFIKDNNHPNAYFNLKSNTRYFTEDEKNNKYIISTKSIESLKNKFPTISFPSSISKKDALYIASLYQEYLVNMAKIKDINPSIVLSLHKDLEDKIIKRIEKTSFIQRILKR